MGLHIGQAAGRYRPHGIATLSAAEVDRSGAENRAGLPILRPDRISGAEPLSSAGEHVRLGIEGMTCQGSADRIVESLQSLPGVRSVQVDLEGGAADIEFAPGKAGVANLKQAVANAGYRVGPASGSAANGPALISDPLRARNPQPGQADFTIEGMTCAGCVAAIENAVSSLAGVERCEVNLANRSAHVRFDRTKTDLAAVFTAVRAAGYEPRERGRKRAGEAADSEEAVLLARRLWVSAVFTLPLLVLAMAHGLADFPGSRWVQSALALPVIFYGGGSFYRAAWSSVLRRRADMNTLVAVGAGAALVYSFAATVSPDWVSGQASAPVYYETAAAIVTLILLGRVLESRARRRTSSAVRKLMALQVSTARVARGGVEMEAPVEEVIAGDTVIVRPGESLPVDGTVVDGRSAVTESALTGESMPVDKQPGDRVFAGTLNGTGSLTFRAEGVGEETVLAKIVAFVERAQGTKAPVARLADRIAAYFVPAVIAAAAATFAVWYTLGSVDPLRTALVNAVAVLIIACPCAMGLATPTAIMVGIGRGAERGILIRNGAAIEAAHSVRSVVLDKTGTLTTGKFAVTDVASFGDLTDEELLDTLAAIESRSEHPLAAALSAAGSGRRVAVEDFEALPGLGVQARAAGQLWLVGKPDLLAQRGLDYRPAERMIERFAQQGKTVVLAAREHQVVGAVAMADGVREDAAAAVEALRGRGIETLMITGDNRLTAQAVAEQVGVDDVIAEVLPNEKAACIERLQNEGRTVAMIGDGINDAPALAQAEVGIAIGAGADIAIEAADMILARSRPGDIVAALELSRMTMRTIRQNLFWAFAYNTIGIPIAAGLFYPWTGMLLSPVLASAAMALSSVSVVTNSLRLRRALPR